MRSFNPPDLPVQIYCDVISEDLNVVVSTIRIPNMSDMYETCLFKGADSEILLRSHNPEAVRAAHHAAVNAMNFFFPTDKDI